MLKYFIVCPLVFIAGYIDAIAGGGGLITLPAYMLCGLPVHQAIATNKMSSTMGTTTATIKYIRSGYILWRFVPAAILGAVCGSTAGANLSLLVSDYYLKLMMLIILPVTAFYVLRAKRMDKPAEDLPLVKTMLVTLCVAFVVGVYDGFYGPGTGTFLILLLSGLAHLSLAQSNGMTKVINLTTNVSALTVFLINGQVDLPLGITAGLFNVAANYLGASSFSKKGAGFTRPVMLLVLAIFFVKVIIELFF